MSSTITEAPKLTFLQADSLNRHVPAILKPSVHVALKPSVHVALKPSTKSDVLVSLKPSIKQSVSVTLKPSIKPSVPVALKPSIKPSVPVALEPSTKSVALKATEDKPDKPKKHRKPRRPAYTFEEMYEQVSAELKTLTAALTHVKRIVSKLNTAHRAEAATITRKPRKPTGFYCPALLDDKLRNFLKHATDEDRTVTSQNVTTLIPVDISATDEYPRHLITSVIHQYIVRNGLQNENDHRIIDYTRDKNLWELFNEDKPTDSDSELMSNIRNGTAEIGYLILQKVLKYRYISAKKHTESLS